MYSYVMFSYDLFFMYYHYKVDVERLVTPPASTSGRPEVSRAPAGPTLRSQPVYYFSSYLNIYFILF